MTVFRQSRSSTPLTNVRYITVVSVILTLLLGFSILTFAAGEALAQDVLVVYCGRNNEQVEPIFAQFEEKYGVQLKVRYGKSAELVATILEEGDRSPADLFFSQDAGALGALSEGRMLAILPEKLLNRVEKRFRSPQGEWVGITGRARVVAYSSERVNVDELPDSILGFTDPKWKNRIGWPPTNASFQAFVTGMRVSLGDEATRQWLLGIKANAPKIYPKNMPIIDAIAKGEVDVGFVNHYYVYRFKAEFGVDFPVENHYLRAKDPGALINVAGIGILKSGKHRKAAEDLIEFLLSDSAQRYFAQNTYEYPLVAGIPAYPGLRPLDQIETPDIDLSSLGDLINTLKLLDEVGVLY